MGVVSQIFRDMQIFVKTLTGRPSPLRWRVPTLLRPSRPRSRTRRESPLTSSALSSLASNSRMAAPPGLQHPEGVDPPPGAPPVWCRCPQVQPLEEVHRQDALEVEEEAYASPPASSSQDASTLQDADKVPGA